MKPTELGASQSGRSPCASCSESTNSCAGCLNAPAYGNDVPQRTTYCSAQCQRADWTAHKAECKVLQTRKSLFRAATVLGAALGVVDGEGKQSMVRLAVFFTELLGDLAVTVDEVTAVPFTNETADTPQIPRARYIYKVTFNNVDETWAVDLDEAYPPSPWADYLREGSLKVESKHALGFHRRNETFLDPVTGALERQIAAATAARGGKLGSFLKGSESIFQSEMRRLVGEIQAAITTAAQNISNGQSPGSPSPIPSTLVSGQSSSQRLYRIQAIPGKGQGMIAASAIPKGARILCEAPTVKIPGNPQDETSALLLNMVLTQQLDNLSSQARQGFYALHSNYGSEYPRAVGIAKTNALPLGHNVREGGIFLEASRINHSCLNNAENTWNVPLGKLTIHATLDIPPGEEVTISYAAAFLSYSERQAHLLDKFGFRCTCARCALSPAERKQSDQRLQRLVALEAEIGDGVRIVTTPLACLKKTRQMLQLLREEGMNEATISRVYYDAFQVAIAHGDQARARVFVKRWYENKVVVEGEDGENAVRAKALADNPSSHRLYGTTMKWKQAAGTVPSGLSEEAFESWLWRENGVA